ncbi:hypothetical protein KFU94_49670 [Chloroflexi bacterium TSY]|nr:hypothetical protein [Chloroflexi bacterium TSY]
MKKLKSYFSQYSPYLAIFVTGSGVGWLVGLSISPVVSIVITSVAGSAAAIIAAMSGVDKKATDDSNDNHRSHAQWTVNPAPLTWLVVGLIVGLILGILARNNHLLGSDISTEIKRWSKAGLIQAGLSKEEIVLKLFEAQISTVAAGGEEATQSGASTPSTGTVLFTISADECGALRRTLYGSEQDLKRAVDRVKQLKNLSGVVNNPETLKNIVEQVLCPID